MTFKHKNLQHRHSNLTFSDQLDLLDLRSSLQVIWNTKDRSDFNVLIDFHKRLEYQMRIVLFKISYSITNSLGY